MKDERLSVQKSRHDGFGEPAGSSGEQLSARLRIYPGRPLRSHRGIPSREFS